MNDTTGDIGLRQDYSVMVMNLVAIEEHLQFNIAKTGKQEYCDILKEIRALRAKHLLELNGKLEAENWCISKHILAASMRLFETATKYLDTGNDTKAKELYKEALDLLGVFHLIQKIGGSDGNIRQS